MAQRAPREPVIAETAEAPPSLEEEVDPASGDRFVQLGVLGRGAMGEVQLVYDQALGRELARKELREDRVPREGAIERFWREARTTAQLEHPGIVPVFDLGTLDDGRPFYTMQRVRGRTLTELIREAHRGQEGLPVRRLVELVRRVCEVVAYAHSRGVTHRDLKPDNVLVGAFGEVWVVDWGLASLAEGLDAPDPRLPARGQVLGTPSYVAPELARGEPATAGSASDVFTLGGVLYEALSGRPPRLGPLHEVMEQARRGAQPPPIHRVDLELWRIVTRAMASDPAHRHAHAGELLAELSAWLDGVRRRERALELVAEADQHAAQESALLSQAGELALQAARLLAPLHSYDPAPLKQHAWALEDEAAALRGRASLAGVQQVQTLHAALRVDPELPEAHARLADRYQLQHREAEQARDPHAASRFELLLRAHERGEYKSYLIGEGRLTLLSEPSGAEVVAAPYVLVGRRLVPGAPMPLGCTPLRDVALPHGSYLLSLSCGALAARVPIEIPRGGRWDGVPPGATESLPIRLLETTCGYVPAGHFGSGGDPEAADGLPARRLWVDGFVIDRDPVTIDAYLTFLNALVAQGRRAEAEARAPGLPEGHLRQDSQGRFWRSEDALEPIEPGTPVTHLSWHDALAYARWRGASDGLPWRLPHSLEWEKAARGVDRRFFPWGDVLEPTWACVVDAFPMRARPGPVDRWPLDESPYGVRGLVGNVRDWCMDRYERHGSDLSSGRLDLRGFSLEAEGWRSVRGGAAASGRSLVRPATRLACPPDGRFNYVGFRLARSIG